MYGDFDGVGRLCSPPAIISMKFAAVNVGRGFPCILLQLESIATDAVKVFMQLCIEVGLVTYSVVEDFVDSVFVVLLCGWSVNWCCCIVYCRLAFLVGKVFRQDSDGVEGGVWWNDGRGFVRVFSPCGEVRQA